MYSGTRWTSPPFHLTVPLMPLAPDDLTGWTMLRLRSVRAACEHALETPALWPAKDNRLWLAWLNAEIAARLLERDSTGCASGGKSQPTLAIRLLSAQ